MNEQPSLFGQGEGVGLRAVTPLADDSGAGLPLFDGRPIPVKEKLEQLDLFSTRARAGNPGQEDRNEGHNDERNI